MCWYQATFDLDLDLEHLLDTGPSGDYGVQVWSRSSHLSGERSICAKCLQTDGRTDDGRRAISSWNSWTRTRGAQLSAGYTVNTASRAARSDIDIFIALAAAAEV